MFRTVWNFIKNNDMHTEHLFQNKSGNGNKGGGIAALFTQLPQQYYGCQTAQQWKYPQQIKGKKLYPPMQKYGVDDLIVGNDIGVIDFFRALQQREIQYGQRFIKP